MVLLASWTYLVANLYMSFSCIPSSWPKFQSLPSPLANLVDMGLFVFEFTIMYKGYLCYG